MLHQEAESAEVELRPELARARSKKRTLAATA
jgi:hypothetical protein